jgi:hypothetical protein
MNPDIASLIRATCLSHYLASRGFPVPDDLPGIDRPDLVDALVREVYGWAGLSVPR